MGSEFAPTPSLSTVNATGVAAQRVRRPADAQPPRWRRCSSSLSMAGLCATGCSLARSAAPTRDCCRRTATRCGALSRRRSARMSMSTSIRRSRGPLPRRRCFPRAACRDAPPRPGPAHRAAVTFPCRCQLRRQRPRAPQRPGGAAFMVWRVSARRFRGAAIVSGLCPNRRNPEMRAERAPPVTAADHGGDDRESAGLSVRSGAGAASRDLHYRRDRRRHCHRRSTRRS